VGTCILLNFLFSIVHRFKMSRKISCSEGFDALLNGIAIVCIGVAIVSIPMYYNILNNPDIKIFKHLLFGVENFSPLFQMIFKLFLSFGAGGMAAMSGMYMTTSSTMMAIYVQSQSVWMDKLRQHW